MKLGKNAKIFKGWENFLTAEMKEVLKDYGVTIIFSDHSGTLVCLEDIKSKTTTMGLIFFFHLVQIVLGDENLKSVMKDCSHFLGDLDLTTKEEREEIKNRALIISKGQSKEFNLKRFKDYFFK